MALDAFEKLRVQQLVHILCQAIGSIVPSLQLPSFHRDLLHVVLAQQEQITRAGDHLPPGSGIYPAHVTGREGADIFRTPRPFLRRFALPQDQEIHFAVIGGIPVPPHRRTDLAVDGWRHRLPLFGHKAVETAGVAGPFVAEALARVGCHPPGLCQGCKTVPLSFPGPANGFNFRISGQRLELHHGNIALRGDQGLPLLAQQPVIEPPGRGILHRLCGDHHIFWVHNGIFL